MARRLLLAAALLSALNLGLGTTPDHAALRGIMMNDASLPRGDKATINYGGKIVPEGVKSASDPSAVVANAEKVAATYSNETMHGGQRRLAVCCTTDCAMFCDNGWHCCVDNTAHMYCGRPSC